MTFHFREARRENVPLLIGLAGGTGSGKTMSALLLASGIAGDRPFYGIDTENGRMLHYADDFNFRHGALDAPFRPERYADAIEAAIKDADHERPVVVVDSFSHEHAGEGGLLDWHEEELQRMAGNDYAKRERVKMAAWIKPKMAHKAMVNRLLQVGAHLILCLRAEEKIEIVKRDGKTEIVPKRLPGAGLDGWIPIAEKNLPYELTASFLLTADSPGVPKPIKLPEQFKPFFPLDQRITAEAGAALGAWAAGGDMPAPPDTTADEFEVAKAELLELVDKFGAREATEKALANHVGDLGWVRRAIRTARKRIAEEAPEPEVEPAAEPVQGSVFEAMVPAAVREQG